MNGRLERGLQIAQSGGVTPYKDPHSPNSQRLFKVKSSNPSMPPYLVDLVARTCTCPDHWKGHYCKHRVAAQIYELAGTKASSKQPSNGKTPSEPVLEEYIDSESLIWACMRMNGKVIGVEVLGIEGNSVRVQALPAVTQDGKLEPQFPFPHGSLSNLVQAQDLFRIRVFRSG
jgi:hypothetical protein